jgi:poly(3-hydroxyalkanoate) synthetase
MKLIRIYWQWLEDPTCGTVFRYFLASSTRRIDLGNTSFPIFFVSNKLDPITPLSGARAMAERFPGSALLEQYAVGVCPWIISYSMNLD